MDFEALKVLFEEFDLAAFLPDMSSVLGWVETGLRIAVMAGPLLLLMFGLLYLLWPPKEANHGLGYRCWWGMAACRRSCLVGPWRGADRYHGADLQRLPPHGPYGHGLVGSHLPDLGGSSCCHCLSGDQYHCCPCLL